MNHPTSIHIDIYYFITIMLVLIVGLFSSAIPSSPNLVVQDSPTDMYATQAAQTVEAALSQVGQSNTPIYITSTPTPDVAILSKQFSTPYVKPTQLMINIPRSAPALASTTSITKFAKQVAIRNQQGIKAIIFFIVLMGFLLICRFIILQFIHKTAVYYPNSTTRLFSIKLTETFPDSYFLDLANTILALLFRTLLILISIIEIIFSRLSVVSIGLAVTITLTVYNLLRTILSFHDNKVSNIVISNEEAANIPTDLQLYIKTKNLDFGTLRPRRIRWLPIHIQSELNSIKNKKLIVRSEQSWITIRPMVVTCTNGSHQHILRASISATPLLGQNAHRTELYISLPDNSDKAIPVRAKVAHPSLIEAFFVTLVNLLVGGVVGLISIGFLGNLVYWGFERNFNDLLVNCSFLIGSLVLMIVSLKIQDSIHLGLSLIIGALLGVLGGLLTGTIIGLLLSYLFHQKLLLPSFGVSIFVGELYGIIYICIHPEIWGKWPL